MAEMQETRPAQCAKDWAGDWLTFGLLWGLPAAAMVAAMLLEPGPRSVVWTASLLWMGAACIANARQCGRTHCRYTGPFFIMMGAAVVAYASGVLPLGPYGWLILGATAGIGNAAIWWASEHLLGKFTRSA